VSKLLREKFRVPELDHWSAEGLGDRVEAPGRPRVTDYYARLRARPSFAAQVTRYQRKPYVVGQVIRGKFSRALQSRTA